MYAEPVKMSKATGSIIRGKGQIHTGSSSRIELELPFGAIVRVGSNSAFFFSPNYRNLSLDRGAMMFSAPKDKVGVIIKSGNVTSTTIGGSVQISNVNGRVKVITLDGKVTSSLDTNPGKEARMRPGDMVDVSADATTMPEVTAIKLGVMIKSSVLINMGPFPALRAINQNATSQAPPSIPFFVTGGFDPDWGGGGGTGSTIGPAGVASMIGRMEQKQLLTTRTTTLAFPVPAPVPPSASVQNAVSTEAQQQAQQAAAARMAALLAVTRRAIIEQRMQRQQAAAQQQAAAAQQAATQQPNTGNGGQGNQGNAFGPGGNPNNPNQGQGPVDQGNQGQGGGQGRQ
jgi:hypothetical protein